MRTLSFLWWIILSGMALANDRAVEAAVHASFNDMPRVERVADLSMLCGARGQANADVIYCTSENVVYLRNGARQSGYLLAHVMGHAAQVRHGIADIALREIRARPSEEAALRALVTRQVECVAGFLLARASLDAPDLNAAFDEEPFTGSHWGRNPLRIGPRVSIGLAARAEWLRHGHAADNLAACAVGEIGAELLVTAYKG